MGMHEGTGQLAKAMKILMERWQQTRGEWDDEVSVRFEKTFLEPLNSDLRSALRDLVTLSTTSTAIEAEIEHKYKTTTDRAKRELDHANWSAEQRHRQHVDIAQQTHDRAVADATSKFVSEREAVLAKDRGI